MSIRFPFFIIFLVGSALLFQSVQTNYWQTRGELRVWFLDVGQGDSALIQTPQGKHYLIDGGPDLSALMRVGERLLPFDRHIDGVFLTHADSDHVAGLIPFIDRYDIDQLYTQEDTHNSAWVSEILRQRIPVQMLISGDRIESDAVALTVLSPPKEYVADNPNDASLVLLLTYGQTRFLFMGDAPTVIEENIKKSLSTVDLLKVGHHGSITSSSIDFLQTVLPKTAIISVGKNNPFHHPHPVVLERLGTIQATVQRTDTLGSLLFSSNGTTVH